MGSFFKNSNKILANVQNEIDMHNKEKDELNTIKKMLVDIQNLLKGDYGQNIRESIGLVNELKRVMLNMTHRRNICFLHMEQGTDVAL